MKTKNIYPVHLLLLSLAILFCCSKEQGKQMMTVSSHSSGALDLYRQAYESARCVVDLDKAISLYEQAIGEEHDFFMAHYQLATYYLFHENDPGFRSSALAALECKGRLSKGEQLQQKALKDWLDNKDADVSTWGRALVELYPDDRDAWINLGFYNYMGRHYNAAIAAFEKARVLEPKDALYCGPKLAIIPECMLGYTYLLTDQPDMARTTFDDYIRQYPDEQNPYDCMADYFMAVGDYGKAFENYMTAFRLDTTHDIYRQRALNALSLLDHQQRN